MEAQAKKLTIIGVGPGHSDSLTQQARATIDDAALVFAAERHAALATGKPTLPLQPFGEACEAMERALCDQNIGKIAVLVSGDPTQFSLASVLKKRLLRTIDEAKASIDLAIEILPGVGSIETLFCRLGESREDAVLSSLHGRSFDQGALCAKVRHNALTVFLTDKENNAVRLCTALHQNGLGFVDVAVGENLSYSDECIVRGKAHELIAAEIGGNSVVRIRNANAQSLPVAPSLKDNEFVRGERPMSKEEIRMLSVCKLRLTPDAIVWDAGAGTGSVALQCALLSPFGKVYAIEREPEGIGLITQNAQMLHAANLVAVAGEMPKALQSLPDPSHVFIGGSGGQLSDILAGICRRGSGIRVVLNAVTIQTAHAAMEALQGHCFSDFEMIQVQVNRAGKAGIMHAGNPVYILSAETA